MPEILLVEDDLHLRETLQEALTQQGYVTYAAESCSEALKLFSERRPAFAVLDIGLPDGSGLDLAKKFLRERKDSRILFLTALGSPQERLRGLEIGAVDYVSKPFHLKELILRLKNLSTTETVTVTIGKATVYFDRFLVTEGGHSHTLSARECSLLKLLYDRAPEVVSRDLILESLWPDDPEGLPSTRTIDNYIVRLRRILETDPSTPTLLQSVWGVGYVLKVEKKP